VKHSPEKLLNVKRVVLLDTLCRTLIELRRAVADDAKSDGQKFIDAAKDIIREAIAAEDVAIEEEAMVVEAVIEDLRFAFEEANSAFVGIEGPEGKLIASSRVDK
jgi:hypothetical protein